MSQAAEKLSAQVGEATTSFAMTSLPMNMERIIDATAKLAGQSFASNGKDFSLVADNSNSAVAASAPAAP